MGNKIEFVHYLHETGSINENVENFEYSFQSRVAPTPDLGDVEYDVALKAVDTFYENRPFYEIGIRISLDVETGEYEILGTV